jgi:hypothetical protein
MSNIFLKIERLKMSCEEHKVFGPMGKVKSKCEKN